MATASPTAVKPTGRCPRTARQECPDCKFSRCWNRPSRSKGKSLFTMKTLNDFEQWGERRSRVPSLHTAQATMHCHIATTFHYSSLGKQHFLPLARLIDGL